MPAGFKTARCPDCDEVVLEIMVGASRGKCPGCKRRVWVMCDGDDIVIGMVDALPARLPH